MTTLATSSTYAQATGTAPPRQQQRTEADARAAAERFRTQRAEQLKQTGKPAELIADYLEAVVLPVPESLGVDRFYKKYVDAMGIPVVASEKVPDQALVVARDIVNTMLAARPDLRKAMIARKWRTGVIAEVEMTSDIPEYSKLKRPGAPQGEPHNQLDRDYHANRSRGLGGNPTTGAEENILGYPGTRYWGEHIFVHEFAHAIMGGGIRDVDPKMHAEIRAAYDSAMAAGKYVHPDGRKHYATTNAGEYWAEGAQWWFYSNYGECFAGNIKVESPEEFKAYDPRLFELLSRVFDTHRIPMDVFHAKRIRPVTCAGAQEARSVTADSTWTRTATGLSFRVLEPGTGEPARNGQSVTIHEITTLQNGTVVFDSRAKGTPVTFLLGGSQVIAGVEQGVTGMRVGEKRRLLVPPTLSVRAMYPANTPRDSTLIIDIELMGVRVR